MPMFFYQGRDASGKSVTGYIKTNSVDEVVVYLQKNKIIPLKINIEKEHLSLNDRLTKALHLEKVTPRDVMNFCRQLAVLTEASVPLNKSIYQLAQSTKNRMFSEILSAIAEDITAGRSLSNALRKHSQVFSSVIINIIEVGENTGHLAEVLIQLYTYIETSIKNRRRLVSAMRYPSFVIGSVMVAMMVLNVFVIPKFATIFSRFGVELPFATRAIIGSSNFIVNHWSLLLMGVIALYITLKYSLKKPKVRYLWDKYKLSIPLIGNIASRIVLSQFAWTFSLILRSGVPIIQGITLAGNASGNAFFSRQILLMRSNIEHGESFSQSASMSKLFLPTTLQMIEVGEESGRLNDILLDVARYYESEVDYDIQRLKELIEPILLAAIGFMVLILALGIYFPMWDLIKVAKF